VVVENKAGAGGAIGMAQFVNNEKATGTRCWWPVPSPSAR
jgi:tripartite-type tricarboxylate transporter receptor subunit TctC